MLCCSLHLHSSPSFLRPLSVFLREDCGKIRRYKPKFWVSVFLESSDRSSSFRSRRRSMRIRGGRPSWQWRTDAPAVAIGDPPETKKDVYEAPTSSSSEYSSNSSPSSEFTAGCEGLDLLAKAVRHVVGDVLHGSAAALMMESEFWVPFMQRRVVRRRKKACWLRKAGEIEGEAVEMEKKSLIREKSMIGVESERVASSGLRPKRRRLPTRHDDSMLPPWNGSKRARSARRPDLGAQQPSD